MKKRKLKNIAPLLSQIPSKDAGFMVPKGYFKGVETTLFQMVKNNQNQHSFNIPSNYFDTIEDQVISKLKIESIENQAKIPDNYFETVENKVFEKIKKESKVLSLKTKIKSNFTPIAIAASILIIFTLNSNKTKNTFESLPISEIEELIDMGSISIEADNLALAFPDIHITTIHTTEIITDDEAIEYLIEQDFEELIYDNY